jgi:hypothetical protein
MVYQGGKPEERHQLVEAIDVAMTGNRNKLGYMLWQNLVA